MGLRDLIRSQLIDIIEWTDDSNDTMVYRYERQDNEIKYGAKLVVRESQVAAFVNMGKIADVFQPGMYELETKNLPILSTLLGWKYGFESPFKAEVYFVNTRRFTDLKWGTKNPVIRRDPEFGMVRLRAFGTYAVRVSDAATFIREIVGTDSHFTTDEVTEQLRNIVVSRFSDAIAESAIPMLDIASNYDELGVKVLEQIQSELTAYGLELTKLLVENVSLPQAVEEAMDKRTSMGVLGDLGRYAQFQSANAMEDAAKNPGGMAGMGVGMGAGFAMGNQMAQAMAPPAAPSSAAPSAGAAPPPLPSAVTYFAAIGGAQAGPFDMPTLQAKVRSGEISRDTLVWKQGMANWTAAGQVAELGSLFASVPPPLPPG